MTRTHTHFQTRKFRSVNIRGWFNTTRESGKAKIVAGSSDSNPVFSQRYHFGVWPHSPGRHGSRSRECGVRNQKPDRVTVSSSRDGRSPVLREGAWQVPSPTQGPATPGESRTSQTFTAPNPRGSCENEPSHPLGPHGAFGAAFSTRSQKRTGGKAPEVNKSHPLFLLPGRGAFFLHPCRPGGGATDLRSESRCAVRGSRARGYSNKVNLINFRGHQESLLYMRGSRV